MRRKSKLLGCRGWQMVVIIAGIFLLNACGKNTGTSPNEEPTVVEEWSGNLYTLTVGRDSKIFDISKVEDQMRLAKFKEKHRAALEEYQRQKELEAQQEQQMHQQDVQTGSSGQGEGVLRSYP